MITIKMQPPVDGCDNCGKYSEEPDNIKRKMLKHVGSNWLCAECQKEEKEPES